MASKATFRCVQGQKFCPLSLPLLSRCRDKLCPNYLAVKIIWHTAWMKKQRNSPRPEDHVGRVEIQWRREMPDVALDGMRILGRARRVTLAVRPRIEAVFEEHDLDTGQFDVLATLRRSGAPYALRPTELFRSLMITSSGLTDRLHRLESLGLVRREQDVADRRSILVRLTSRGKTTIESAFRQDMQVENDIVNVLSARERTQLARLLAKLAKKLEKS